MLKVILILQALCSSTIESPTVCQVAWTDRSVMISGYHKNDYVYCIIQNTADALCLQATLELESDPGVFDAK
jgi:hypothetical protein